MQVAICIGKHNFVIISYSISLGYCLGISISITVPFFITLPASLLLKRIGLIIVALAISGCFPRDKESASAKSNFRMNSFDVNLTTFTENSGSSSDTWSVEPRITSNLINFDRSI